MASTCFTCFLVLSCLLCFEFGEPKAIKNTNETNISKNEDPLSIPEKIDQKFQDYLKENNNSIQISRPLIIKSINQDSSLFSLKKLVNLRDYAKALFFKYQLPFIIGGAVFCGFMISVFASLFFMRYGDSQRADKNNGIEYLELKKRSREDKKVEQEADAKIKMSAESEEDCFTLEDDLSETPVIHTANAQTSYDFRSSSELPEDTQYPHDAQTQFVYTLKSEEGEHLLMRGNKVGSQPKDIAAQHQFPPAVYHQQPSCQLEGEGYKVVQECRQLKNLAPPLHYPHQVQRQPLYILNPEETASVQGNMQSRVCQPARGIAEPPQFPHEGQQQQLYRINPEQGQPRIQGAKESNFQTVYNMQGQPMYKIKTKDIPMYQGSPTENLKANPQYFNDVKPQPSSKRKYEKQYPLYPSLSVLVTETSQKLEGMFAVATEANG